MIFLEKWKFLSILIYGMKIGKFCHQYFTSPYPLYENSQKWGKIQKLQLSEHFSGKQKGHEFVIEIQRGKVSNPKSMATVEV